MRTMNSPMQYEKNSISRSELEALEAPVALDFGTNWCGICRAAQPLIANALAAHPDVRHIRVEDGPGRRLGRSFGVKLWPTLIFMRHGREVSRVVRPTDAAQIADALAALDQAR